MADISRQKFWRNYQPGLRSSSCEPGTAEFFSEVDAFRYTLEPHLLEIARFDDWSNRDVLEAGCGMGTDGVRFARAGARYTGFDESQVALDLAQRRFDIDTQQGRFVRGSVHDLPFANDSFDLVFSNGVIHHTDQTERAVAEFHRVLRPGGTAIVMVYHRDSLNYYVNIMLLRRMMVAVLLLPGADSLLSRITNERPDVVHGHVALLHEHGVNDIRDGALFLSNNTDGPGNPLSTVYGRGQAAAMFGNFAHTRTHVRFLNLRLYPGGRRISRTRAARVVERFIGWHLYVEAVKESLP